MTAKNVNQNFHRIKSTKTSFGVERNKFWEFMISFYTCKNCTKVFETMQCPSEYTHRTQSNIKFTNLLLKII